MFIVIEPTEKQAYASLFSSAPFSFPSWIQGGIVPIEVIIANRIQQNATNQQIFAPVNASAYAIKVALGNGYLGPLAGQWFLQSGVNLSSGTVTNTKRFIIQNYVAGDDFTNIGAATNTTGVEFVAIGTTPTTWTNGSDLQEICANLNWNSAASDVQTALNNMAIVTAAGGVTVTTSGTLFIAQWAAPGAVTTLVGNGGGLAPLSIVDVSPLITGTSQIEAVQTVRLVQNPGAFQLLGNASAAASVACIRTQIGGGGFNETWQVVVDSRSFAGIFNLVFTNAASAVQESNPIVFNTTDVAMQSTLQALTNIGVGNLSVSQVAPWTYVLQFIGSLANQAINAAAFVGAPGGLQVPLGRYDNLNLQTAALDLILNGAQSAGIKCEIRSQPPAGVEDYVLQQSQTLISSIVPPASSTPAPTLVVNAENINFNGLPTSLPATSGILWNNGGTLAIS